MAAFLDTNILLYALSTVNTAEVKKVAIAQQLVEALTASQSLIISAQVLSEFTSVASRKGPTPLTISQIEMVVEDLSQQTVIPIDASLVQLALRHVQASQLSYWDSLIVEAALRARATTLYTEDMNHGTRFGTLELINPFV
jgi:predicted nucleic acid-binding protein